MGHTRAYVEQVLQQLKGRSWQGLAGIQQQDLQSVSKARPGCQPIEYMHVCQQA